MALQLRTMYINYKSILIIRYMEEWYIRKKAILIKTQIQGIMTKCIVLYNKHSCMILSHEV